MRLTLNDVTVSLGDHPVLRGASLDVAPGTRIALVGANGSGKSTLLLTLAGAIKPGRGVVEVDESPRLAVSRELQEELALDLPAGALVLTDWLPPWGGAVWCGGGPPAIALPSGKAWCYPPAALLWAGFC